VTKRVAVHESTFQAECVKAFNAPGRATRVFRVNAGKHVIRDELGQKQSVVQGAPDGCPDLIGWVRGPSPTAKTAGWFLGIELKSATAPYTEEQERWGVRIIEAGGVYAFCRYDEACSLEENVASAVATVDRKIEERKLA